MTTSVLLTYHSQEGQTAKIGDRIASVLRNEGATVTIASTDDDPSPAGFDGVILATLVEDQRLDSGVAQQRFNKRDENNVVGPDELFH